MNHNEQILEFHEIKKQLLKYCSFSLGKAVIEKLEPSFEELELRKRLTLSQEALALAIHRQGFDFSGIKDLTTTLIKAKKDITCSASELLDVASFSDTCQAVTNSLPSELDLPQLQDLVSTLITFTELKQKILSVISEFQEVKKDATPRLSELYHKKIQLTSEIRKTMQNYLLQHKDSLMEEVISTRNERQVVLVKVASKNKLRGIIHGETSSGQAVYLEPAAVVILNNDLASTEIAINKEIATILFDLSQEVKIYADQYLANLETLAYLDALNACSLWGKDRDACIPEIDSNGSIEIIQARHPLIEEQAIVKNDYRLIRPHNLLLITGSNTGGKTVSLKTIGLFVYLMHLGLPLTCEKANLPLVDAIFIDMGDQQSVVDSLSTFSSHLKTLSKICRKATAKSLVLLDELGGGTDPLEGESIAIAVLKYLKEINALVVATTHLGGLKNFGQASDLTTVSSVEFDLKTLKPTYRYLEGYIGQSNALSIAKRYGFPFKIINEAQQQLNDRKSDEVKVLEEINNKRLLLEQEQQLLQQEIEDLHLKTKQLESEKKALKSREENYKQELEAQYEIQFNTLEKDFKKLYQEMKKAHKEGNLQKGYHIIQEIQKKESKEDLDEDILVNDYVRFKGGNSQGQVLEIKGKNYVIGISGKTIRASKKDLVKVSTPIKKAIKPTLTVKSLHPGTYKLNIIGKTVAEAKPLVEKFLDEAATSQLGLVQIVHGVGSGALRKMVHDILSNKKYVTSFKLDEHSIGGATDIKLGK